MVKREHIELIFSLVNKKALFQRVNAIKIVIKNGSYFILNPVKKKPIMLWKVQPNCISEGLIEMGVMLILDFGI
jgi:hypothetical protein